MIREVVAKILDSPVYILITIINIALVTAIILAIWEIKIKKKFKKPEKSKYDFYIEDLKNIKNSNKKIKLKLDALNGVSKDFFEYNFGLNKDLTYSELIEKFQQRNNKETASFCESMLITYYTQERLNEQKINLLILDLIKIIKKEGEKKEIEKAYPEEEQGLLKTILSLIIPGMKTQKEYEEGFNEINSMEQKLKKEIADILSHKKEIDKIKEELLSDKKTRNLIKKKIKSKEELQDLFDKNKDAYNEFKKIYSLTKYSHEKLDSISNEIYNRANPEQKKVLRAIIIEWQKEHKNRLDKITNPFHQQLIESELLSKYFIKIIIIAKSSFSKKDKF